MRAGLLRICKPGCASMRYLVQVESWQAVGTFSAGAAVGGGGGGREGLLHVISTYPSPYSGHGLIETEKLFKRVFKLKTTKKKKKKKKTVRSCLSPHLQSNLKCSRELRRRRLACVIVVRLNIGHLCRLKVHYFFLFVVFDVQHSRKVCGCFGQRPVKSYLIVYATTDHPDLHL